MKQQYQSEASKRNIKQRETNKNEIIKEQFPNDEQTVQQIKIRDEFKQLRGDHGIKKTFVEQALFESLENIHSKIMNRPKPIDNSHLMFVKKVPGEVEILFEDDYTDRQKKR